MIRIRYFASLREHLDTTEEAIGYEAGLDTVADVAAVLRRRGGRWSEHLGEERTILAAVNQEMAKPDSPVKDGDEVAFFPPVTGG